MGVNNVIKSNHVPHEKQRIKVTAAEILEVKRQHILENLLYSPEQAGEILGKSTRGILDLVKEGKLIAADDKAKKGRNGGLTGSSGLRITAVSIQKYKTSITISPEKWNE